MLGVGRGVFAGRTFQTSDIVDVSSTVTFPLEETYGTQLINFIFGSNHNDYIMALLGPGMLFNHRFETSVNYYWWKKDDDTIPDASTRNYSPFSTYTDIYFKAMKPIRQGDEIFTSYGDEEWFETRDINYIEPLETHKLSRSLEYLKSFGHCLTDVAVRKSLIEGAGKGLFAQRSFKVGEVVSIAPVLLMPKHLLDDVHANSVMINYAMSLPDSDVTLLPLGRAAMVNNGGKNANLKVHWYDWESRRVLHGFDRPSVVNRLSIDDLEASPFASLDISFVATRDVAEGEELTLDYGEQWEKLWVNYRNVLSRTPVFGKSPRPVFLEPVGLEPGMFPDSWFVKCIGSSCSAEVESLDDLEDDGTESFPSVIKKSGFDVSELIKNAKNVHTVNWGKQGATDGVAGSFAGNILHPIESSEKESISIDDIAERNEF